LIAIPVRYLFGALTTLITLLAAGLAAQAINFLQQGGWLEVWTGVLWDTSGVLSQDGIVGRVLHTLVGYADQPTGLQFAVYAATILAMVALMYAARLSNGQARSRPIPATPR
jgi:high-affinity iron transporter